METRLMPCPYCDGDKGWESQPYGISYRDGSLMTVWIRCDHCDATGRTEQQVWPIEMEDLP